MKKSKKYKEPTPCTVVIVKYLDKGYTMKVNKHTDYEMIKDELRYIYQSNKNAYKFVIINGLTNECIMSKFISERYNG